MVHNDLRSGVKQPGAKQQWGKTTMEQNNNGAKQQWSKKTMEQKNNGAKKQ